MLRQVANEIEKRFYDEELRRLDWKELTSQAEQRIDRAESLGAIFTSIHTLVNRLQDSHTNFFPPQRSVRIKFGFQAKPFAEEVRVYSIDEDGQAASAGLEVGDRLVGINGFRVQRESFDQMMLFMRVLMPVAEMKLALVRDSEQMELVIQPDIERKSRVEDFTNLDNIYRLIRELELEEVEEHAFEDYGEGIGYIRVPFFFTKSSLSDAAEESKNSRARIVDLRGNGGGAVEILEHLVGFFEEEDAHIADIVGRKKTEEIEAKHRRPHLSGPLFILVDSQSASAAEIFARHFQRNGSGVVIGDRTAGRVSVSRTFEKRVGANRIVPFAVQIAIGQLVFPDGELLEGSGVTPDVFCVPTTEDQRNEKDTCVEIATELAKEALALDALR